MSSAPANGALPAAQHCIQSGPIKVTEKKKTKNMSKKLFVGGLSWDTRSEELRQAFEGFCSVVEAKVVSDRDTGRSRGFGFVMLGEDADVQDAIKNMDGFFLDGRNLRVNEANDRPAPSRRY